MAGGIIRMEIMVPMEVKRDESWFVASCTPLDVHAQGDSEESAIAELKDALQLFFETCLELGALEQVLKDSGFSVSPVRASVQEEDGALMVPIPLLFSTPSHAAHRPA
ncbi:MAG: type II toxin-antitoxin system HicB family antitoxin [Magnetococcales bacterium]|nr:type II toxin-antitoxin system HicB family antitoxin [Magnetococcales bacterium]